MVVKVLNLQRSAAISTRLVQAQASLLLKARERTPHSSSCCAPGGIFHRSLGHDNLVDSILEQRFYLAENESGHADREIHFVHLVQIKLFVCVVRKFLLAVAPVCLPNVSQLGLSV